MNVLDRLERRLGRWAIPGLLRYIVALNALVYLLLLAAPGYREVLELDRAAILRGEIWRLLSWIFLPTTLSPLWIFFFLMFTWWVGEMLEGTWGAFRLNVYYFLGAAGCTLSAMLFGASGGNFLLTLSLLLAIATLAPNQEVLLLIFPIRLKWLAIISIIYPWGLLLLLGPLPIKAMILVCLGNYLLFFGPQLFAGWRNRIAAASRRPQPDTTSEEPLHLCAACGATELSHPDTEFRVSADGREYCLPCLKKRNPPLR